MATAPTPRVLIVEDERTIQALYRYMLRGYFDIEIASSVDEGLQAAARTRFDLFLLDINLGEDRTGVDLLQLLRALPGYAQTPAVACTAYTMPEERARILRSGFDNYQSKPFSREQLVDVCRRTMAGERAPQPPRPSAAPSLTASPFRNAAA